jgi:transposase-like protein
VVAKIPARFTNEEAARAHLEALQWPNGPICPHCGTIDRASRIAGGRKGLWFCNACRMQFSVTVGTVFERSKVPLNTWLYANHLLCSSKKGISSHQLARMLGVTYKTAWFMSHRIREAMKPADKSRTPMGGEGKPAVQADEMFVGKKSGKRKAPGAGGAGHKIAVLSLTDGTETRSFVLPNVRAHEVKQKLRENVSRKATLHTDGAQAYKALGGIVAKHEAVDHNKEFVRDGISTNMLEGYFSVFKRGLVGTYQHMGEQHVARYLAEFDFRQSTRAALGINDEMRAEKALKGAVGKRLTYRRTNQTQDATPAS